MQAAETLTASRRAPVLAGKLDAHVGRPAGGADFACGAFEALEAHQQVCSAQSSERHWASAEQILLRMARPESGYQICAPRWHAAASSCASYGLTLLKACEAYAHACTVRSADHYASPDHVRLGMAGQEGSYQICVPHHGTLIYFSGHGHTSLEASDAFKHACAVGGSDHPTSADLIHLGVGRPEGRYQICNPCLSAASSAISSHGLTSIMLPITSALMNTPVFATYGLDETQAGSGRHHGPVVLAIDNDSPRGKPVMSHDEVRKALEFLIRARPADDCARQLMASLPAWNRRFFPGFTPTNISGTSRLNIVCQMKIKNARKYYAFTSCDFDIAYLRLKGSHCVTFQEHIPTARRVEVKINGQAKDKEAFFEPHVSLSSGMEHTMKSLQRLVLDTLELPVEPVDDDAETESPFSAENMRLVFLGKRKPKSRDLD